MKKSNLLFTVFAVSIVFAFGLACKSLTSSADKDNGTNTGNKPPAANSNTTSSNTTASNTAKKPDTDTSTSKIEKADFTTTAEELDKEFTRKGVKDADLVKYSNKNIAVSGRVSTITLEKTGTTQPWVTLFAPGVLHGVSCYFDDQDVDQLKKLTMDKMAKVQGFQDDFIVPEVSPMLKHCAVLEAN